MTNSWVNELVRGNRLNPLMRLKVLHALFAAESSGRYGYQLMQVSGLPQSPLYRTLHELVHAGWAESHLEPGDPHRLGRRLRRYYTITEHGRAEIRLMYDMLAQLLSVTSLEPEVEQAAAEEVPTKPALESVSVPGFSEQAAA